MSVLALKNWTLKGSTLKDNASVEERLSHDHLLYSWGSLSEVPSKGGLARGLAANTHSDATEP